MTPSELKHLKELAEKATPGPWQRIGYHSDGSSPYKRVCELYAYGDIYAKVKIDINDNDVNGRYIAAANPQTILKMIETIERYREALEFYADKKSWEANPEDDSFFDCLTKDTDRVQSSTSYIDRYFIYYGGKLARETLAELEKED